MVYHHVIAGWHDTHTSSTEIYYDFDNEAKQDNKLFPVINPATNQPSLYYQETSEDAFEHALNQANAIQQQYYSKNNNKKSLSIVDKAAWWSDPTKSYQRADILMKIADILGNNTDRLADLEVYQIGRPRKEMRFQLSRLPEWFVYYASLLRVGGGGGSEDTTPPFGGDHINIVKRVPLGVVAQITPFNHPLLIAVKKLAPALAAGNCCILKPSEQAPASIIELAIICMEAGVPEGVITVILGGRNVGEMLVRDSRIRKVDFTGGPKAGYKIGAAAGRNVCQMTQELGGKAPMIMSDIINIDEYLDPIINGCAFGAFIASGQTCIAGTRLLVQRDIYSLVCEKMTKKIKSFQMGDPFDMNTTFGPLINTKQMDFVHSTVTSCVGGDENNYNLKLLCGGKRYQRFTGNEKYLNEGNWYEPTINITDVHHNCALFQTEIFGPVLGIIPFEDEDHAIQLANDSTYSLGCSIWTHDLVQAHTVSDRVRAGIIWINDHHKNSPASPWGGLTKESGVGRENGREALMEYSQSKSVVIRTKRFDSDWFKDPNARYN
ncbi:aldehyde dehydrogenase [Fragilariopsis cylindrus CCMP1102]|uniref:Aldehyde dehydrogenase n=1 Tax=Fragilariopsis cylindrus CCMP1102 TaxID=635003 RepID=A0A1E7FIF0_9STRA|nr:aldehyde dehydrogenase [Fragilariopsis cylindrus CCMP1102]|eukprot:OEU17815.1 aldehyde dehydrogenase [Fragilariopsis cylindrus CCMP1102]